MHDLGPKRSLFAAILVCASAAGCSTMRPIYPDSWPEQTMVKNGACPSIDGEYQNAGEWFAGRKYVTNPAGQSVSLAFLLNAGPAYVLYDGSVGEADDLSPDYVNRLGRTHRDPARDAYRTIALRVADDRLHVEASLADGSKRSFSIPARQRCRDSLLFLETELSPAEEYYEFPFNVGRSTYALGRAGDGSLLYHASSWDMMFFIFMPMLAENAESWVRFPVVEQAPAPARTPTP
ncbi:MAG TPA: hypothetical protein VH856_02235 [Steroidobacteraceae bacterium]|jgi:hypothetical protein